MHPHEAAPGGSLVVVIAMLAAVAVYVGPAVANRRQRPWPAYRSVLWSAGIACLGIAAAPGLTGQVTSFVGHTVDHILVGMLAPLLIALSAPVTLALRTLDPVPARRISRLLGRRAVRFVTHPITALVLYAGGMWALYTTDIFRSMHENTLLAALVHVHFFFAGYLFTAAVAAVDPTPHRHRHAYRAVVLAAALAAHGILAKFLFAHPPAGVSGSSAEAGSMLMYYAGDAIDAVLIVVVCGQWFRATRPRAAATPRRPLIRFPQPSDR
ncbi:cytochrome c oxidase assembly protein [Conyzicola nivalis]|uniref:Membrane protein n=1 Tax=Conyzicola nivalis TaxID=1477021 RepID=A0A916SKM3_9MICO|nr:cytochrome c oxidase assembly protein [Conyzicola nivalis]GGB04597.1 membrane protein [Conyzicola nivalis]